MLENELTCSKKCNIHIQYFNKIKCNADRPYQVFSELKPETHIYFIWPYAKSFRVFVYLVCSRGPHPPYPRPRGR